MLQSLLNLEHPMRLGIVLENVSTRDVHNAEFEKLFSLLTSCATIGYVDLHRRLAYLCIKYHDSTKFLQMSSLSLGGWQPQP